MEEEANPGSNDDDKKKSHSQGFGTSQAGVEEEEDYDSEDMD